ncbi:hypothetical protein KM176_15240 [Pseudooceanicola sp. CBS1P-1]|uniref:Uncharacterized protein n=1 Tax=Pseudooceanicola albus TaxID=2692189 RepID=A0A6L7G738_9RHOB|nr:MULTISPECIES: hypothetical protein [Pseudooceanicola]MBT9385225.1 hypothetical protein [Pseudooceanicola endophyticus]MXN18483.1 hypothetical protein [Pseudooceanicola albus]
MERIKMTCAALLMAAVGLAGLGFGLVALLVTAVIGAVAMLAARIAAPVLLKRAEAQMQAMHGAGWRDGPVIRVRMPQ